ncbi:MAG: CSLREA domain-containing protein, partial [Caldilineaceae bacterium]|nr:CSLREA domain-containing protein [Caldilineaceae bacterium]
MHREIPTGRGVSWLIGQSVWLVLVVTLIAGLLAYTGEQAAAAGPFFVDSTADSPDSNPGDGICDAGGEVCTLRAAIQETNALPGLDLIHFALPGGGVQTIAPSSALPQITDPVVIDGYTQPGAVANSQAIGSNAVLLIEISGVSAGGANGLELRASNSVIRGLVVNRFSGAGISLAMTNNTVAGNYLGTDPSGTVARSNGGDGIFVANFVIGAANNTIGGVTPADRNLISGNGRNGITMDQVSNTFVYGNYIGLNATGLAALRNNESGVGIFRGLPNFIGGSAAGQGNVISGNGQHGIAMSDGATSAAHVIRGNLIGTDAAGNVTPGVGNTLNGILFNESSIVIGGLGVGDGNVIAGNGLNGVVVQGGQANQIVGNRIYANGGLGIDLGA